MITIHAHDYEAVLFDMDGTMVDNMGFHQMAWKEFLHKRGFDLSDEDFKKKIAGASNVPILSIFFPQIRSSEEIQKMSDEKEALYRILYAPQIKPLPGLFEFISQLKQSKVRIGIATTASFENTNFILSKLSLRPLFDVVVCDKDVIHGKPDPEVYLETCKRLGVSPERCLTFEDSPRGVSSAKNAGLSVIGVLTQHTVEELTVVMATITDFREVCVQTD